jgi:hypothetical protein
MVMNPIQKKKNINQLIFLAPRFSQNAKGHFFDYTINIANTRLPKVSKLIITEEKVNLNTAGEDVTWESTDFGKNWGNDAGEVSPSRICRKLSSTLDSSTNYGLRNLVTFESSLSLLFALFCLIEKSPRLRIHFNFCDFGFWSKLLSYRLVRLPIKFYIKNIFERYQNQLFFYAQSRSAAETLSKYLGIQIGIFPFLSIMTMKYGNHVTPDLKFMRHEVQQSEGIEQKPSINLLILPWPADENRVLDLLGFLDQTHLQTNLKVRVHSKKPIRGVDRFSQFGREIYFSYGPLPDVEYRAMFQWSDICYLPYSDTYHLSGNSGKMLDSLCNGTFVIVDENTDLQEFTKFNELILKTNHDVGNLLTTIMSKIDEITSSDQHNEQRRQLAKQALRQFSPSNMYEVVSSAQGTKCGNNPDIKSIEENRTVRRTILLTSWMMLRDIALLAQNHIIWRSVWLYQRMKSRRVLSCR